MPNLKDLTTILASDRTYGLVRTAFYGFLTYETSRHGLSNNDIVTIPAMVLGSLLTLEGLADWFSGELHYLPKMIVEYFHNRRQKDAS